MPGSPGASGVHVGQLEAIDITPELAGIGLIVAIAILALVVWIVLRLRRTPADSFVDALAPHDTLDILLHPNPDPDAMASGFAAATIAKAAGLQTRIVYPGQLRHNENRAFRTVLGLELVRLEDVDGFRDQPVVLIDHGQPRGFPASIKVEPIAVIDHHDDPPVEAQHVDVRPHYGACSTILWEYLDDLGAVSEGEAGDLVITQELATALAYGIQTDTNGLTRGVTEFDIDALESLHELVDSSALERISNPPIEAEVLDAKAAAIRNREIYDCYCVSDLGEVGSADSVAVTAEELLTLEGVTTAVSIGEHDGTLYFSGRSIDDRVHMGEALERSMEAVPGASAGGHARMGGAQVSLEALEGLGPTTGIKRDELPELLISALRGSD